MHNTFPKPLREGGGREKEEKKTGKCHICMHWDCDSWLLTAVECSCKTVFLDFFGGYSKILIPSGGDLCLYLQLSQLVMGGVAFLPAS